MKLLHTSALDVIQILGLTARGKHGVYASERAQGQSFTVDVTMHVDTRAAATDDDLSLTVDYSQVAEDVIDILSGPSVYLIETLAQRVAEAILAYDQVQIVEVKVHKPQAPMKLTFSDVSMTIRRERSEKEALSTPDPVHAAQEPPKRKAVIALGGNLNQPWQTMARAIMEIDEREDISVTAVSGLFRTAPVLAQGQDQQPDYYNAVMEIETALPPLDLLHTLQEIEYRGGRERTEKWGARTLDLDIITYQGVRSDDETLTLPHPRAHERAFVLRPWIQIAPEATIGKHGRIKVLLEQITDQQVESIADVWVEEAAQGVYPGMSLPPDTAPLSSGASEVDNSTDGLTVDAALATAPSPAEFPDRGARTQSDQLDSPRDKDTRDTERSATNRHRRSTRTRQRRVRVIDDLDDAELIHAPSASTPTPPRRKQPTMKVDLPDGFERGLLPVDDNSTGPIARTVLRPTVTGAIPIVRRRNKHQRSDT
ncbi:MAG: 2-amino-4-hydroxy-6-hydroxymethyldihydropteridine diphosphokinase [Actinomycetaceae bacterium]|nr:2-amino-4-hydroxy-6-hydroxymethyldihydropteridine diphosphokinase [Actinomycetaceae bacterium]